MIKLTKNTVTSLTAIIALSLTGCTAFETRMQANGDFSYQEAQLIAPYKTGRFSTDEARSDYQLPALTEGQLAAGQLTNAVDLRPPTQLVPVMEGVFLATNAKQTKVVFNAFKQNEDAEAKVRQLVLGYLAEKQIEIKSQDRLYLAEGRYIEQIETVNFTEEEAFGGFLDSNERLRQASYLFSLKKPTDSNSLELYVDLLTYSETNAGEPLKFKLSPRNKSSIELRVVNELLEFAYEQQEAQQLNELNTQPLAIKLGFDDDHQIVWLVDNDFLSTWQKLPELLSLLSFELVKEDINLGLLTVLFDKPDSDYWAENNLNPFTLDEAKYFVQLGESSAGKTSIKWLDEQKKPLSDQKVTEIYLSITDKVRDVLLLNEKQTKTF